MLSGFKPISITSGFPTLTLTKNGVGFNKAAILKMDGPHFVRVAINADENMLALIPCPEDDEYISSGGSRFSYGPSAGGPSLDAASGGDHGKMYFPIGKSSSEYFSEYTGG